MPDPPRPLGIPLSEEDVASLKVGELVAISGTIITARDAAHLWLLQKKREEVAKLLKDGAIYHCGPVTVRNGKGGWDIVSAGPTTSRRMEPYEAGVIECYGVRAIIGKGGMGKRTLDALKEFKAVYINAFGGLGALYCKHIVDHGDVHMLEEFGGPEALWELDVRDMPAIVTMDAHGNSLHDEVLNRSRKAVDRLFRS